MLRGDASGRVPFALVAVLLLISAGLCGIYAAKLAREEAAARAQEARLAVLTQVAEGVHREVLAQAQYIGIDAIGKGTRGILNETRVADAFRDGFADYVASHFPRVVRGVTVRLIDYDARIGLAQRRMDDLQPSNATREESVGGLTISIPDSSAPEVLAPIDRIAYFDVQGYINYTSSTERVSLTKLAPIQGVVPLPAPLLESKLEQASRAGEGDLAGVGHTVKAILASLAQFRVLNGFASPIRPGTTTGDVLTPDDVALAVNLALFLEEIRLFRTFDREAAASVDAAHPPPTVSDGLPPPTGDRTLVRLLDRYASEGIVDATDLHALFTGLDSEGLSLGAVFAQAIAAIADELALKPLDYFGLTPLADWIQNATLQTKGAVDEFLRWLTGTPSRQAEYVFQFVEAVLVETGAGVGFFGPLDLPLPARTYDIPNGSKTIRVSVAAHEFSIPFPAKVLTLKGHDRFWSCYYSTLDADVLALGGTLRGLVDDVAARIADAAVWSGLLPTSATGAVDPKDRVSFLDVLSARATQAVDGALDWFRTNPNAVDLLMEGLWAQTKDILENLVDYMILGYDAPGCAPALVDRPPEVVRAYNAVVDDLFTRGAMAVPLNASQRDALRSVVNADVTQNGWDAAAFDQRKAKDVRNWQRAVDLADDATLPGEHLRAQLREEVGGASGWLSVAASSIKGLLAEAVAGQDVAALRAVYTVTTRPFVLQDIWLNGSALTDRFRVQHSPGHLRPTPGVPDAPAKEGELRIEVVDPADLPPADGTPNVHYTKPTERSRRPFTSEWTVRVAGAVHLRAETADAPLLGSNGPKPIVLERTWALNFSFSFAAYSGWGLAGVRYRQSDTLFSDILSFMALGLADTVRVVRWTLEALRVVFQIVWKMMERLADFTAKIVRWLAEALSHLLDVLRMMAMQVLTFVGPFLDALRTAFPSPKQFDLNLAGILLSVLVSGESGRSLVLAIHAFADARIEFVRLPDSEYRSLTPPGVTYDVLTKWDGSVGPLHQYTAFDPLNITQPKMIEGSALWEGAMRSNYSGPDVESAYLVDRSIPVFVPLEGIDLEITFGAEALVVLPPTTDLDGDFLKSIEEGIEAAGPIGTWRDVGRAIRMIGMRIEDSLLRGIEATVVELSLYVQVDAKVMAAGVGARLALVADGTGVRTVVSWVIRNVAEYFENGMDPFAWARYDDLPRGAMDHISLRAELHFIAGAPNFLRALGIEGEIRLAARIESNVAAIASFMGLDWGSPEIRFGLLVDGRFQFYWLPGLYGVVYLLRGVAVPL